MIIEVMTETEATLCLLAIRGRLDDARQKMLEFDQRLGWKALGYASRAECFEAELKQCFQSGYRLLNAAEVQLNVDKYSLMSEPPVIKKRWVQDSQIMKLEPAQQAEAIQLADEIRQAEDSKEIVARHVEAAVKQLMTKQVVFTSRYFVITQAVTTGKITAETGKEFVQAFERIEARRRGLIAQLMAQFGLTCPALVGPLGSLFGRKADREALILQEVLTGFLGGTSLAQATLSDWRRAAEEAQRQMDSEEMARTAPLVQPMLVTIYKGDVKRTVDALKEALGDEVYNIRDWLLRE